MPTPCGGSGPYCTDAVTVEEATPEECRALCLAELKRAAEADSLDHVRMHMESALIWARGADWPAPTAEATS